MPVLLSRRDARRAAMACRALAVKQRQLAEKQNGAPGAQVLESEARELERLAELFELHARLGLAAARTCR